jgi:hypothetical protein
VSITEAAADERCTYCQVTGRPPRSPDRGDRGVPYTGYCGRCLPPVRVLSAEDEAAVAAGEARWAKVVADDEEFDRQVAAAHAETRRLSEEVEPPWGCPGSR